MTFIKGHNIKKIGTEHHLWKGNNVSYRNLHEWVGRWLGKAKQCSQCYKIGEIKNGRWNIHWANKSGQYKRNLNDWVALCVPCHRKYDAESYKTENTNRKTYYSRWLKRVVPLKRYA